MQNEKMMEVVRGKTDCILRFTHMLREYMETIIIQRKFLGSLREEYAVDSAKVAENLALLEASQLSEVQRGCLAELRTHWGWVDFNYKMGNSFY
jgi:hypothetical protein